MSVAPLAAGLPALPLEIPSPTAGVLHLGPFPLRAYALCILAGIAVAIWMTGRRMEQLGGQRDQVLDVAAYAVGAGILGGRLYHVITTPEPYWGEGGNPVNALKIWEGGLGIWGAISLGALGAWWGCRRHNVPFLRFCDAAAPGVLVAQALGRLGNWFNNELYGGRTDVPWALRIYEWDHGAGRAVVDSSGEPVSLGTFHPTFLYEALWCLALAALIVVVERRRRLVPGMVLGMYVAGYPLGRIIWEKMRTDPAEVILGQRLNVWTSILVFLLGVAIMVWAHRRAGAAGPADDPDAPDQDPTPGDPVDESAETGDDGASPDPVAGDASTAGTGVTDPTRKSDI